MMDGEKGIKKERNKKKREREYNRK